MELTVKDVATWLELSNKYIQENKEYLTELDQKIGDGDHGINMARGFQEVMHKMIEQDYQTISDVLKDTAMTLISKVGGASGPLLGTAFLKMSTSVKGQENLDTAAFSAALNEAVNGVKQRGKSTEGEKTLLDVWSPMADYFSGTDDFSSDSIIETAKKAMADTEDMQATKGRAAYFKEKSVGHIDPGAATSYYIFAGLAYAVKGGNH
ncbi:dihydroxyacetone kinase subunit DhaL [Virgibacillus siamensis]|uniref:dihydroxyacetone kinase subunit DhaL n=1 Tax=Virgibacillus siamensis TaxID=480071 RepID=UPI000985589B|nr:dihydroxyacetone kinase subunit DhaL [Virgibacillus siamensis]